MPKIILKLIKYLILSLRIRPSQPALPESPAIIIIWHEELSAYVKIGLYNESYGLVSLSADGASIAQVMEGFGWKFIRGSTNVGKNQALKSLIRVANLSRVFITADGSKGPRREIKPGALLAAKKTGTPIYLSRAKYLGFRLNTWDRFKIPLLFSVVSCYYSGPFYVKPEDNLKAATKILDLEMKKLAKIVGEDD